MTPHELTLLAGTANPGLASSIARELGVPLGACVIERFPDGEVHACIEESVRGREVYVVQPTSPPVNDHLIELLIIADAARRASAAHITAIVPYFGYARADKRSGCREAITARMVADLLQHTGIDHVITLDLHTPQAEGFFRIPVDNLTAVALLCGAIRDALSDDLVVVAPDAGRVKMATAYAQCLGAPLVVLHKRRESGTHTVVTHLVGDVRDRSCVIVDDIISTGGTIAESAAALLEAGAKPGVSVCATHALLLDGAIERMRSAGVRATFVTDSVPVRDDGTELVHIVSAAALFATAIRRIRADGSLRELRGSRDSGLGTRDS
ncbi:MAG TPA: ribose-phosphate pyrophosphokinase [Gemmatimonadaceae bacterium]|nr:ribose-phosphate pyrophosphokinase [Gemmatimonadaceae bacterium]